MVNKMNKKGQELFWGIGFLLFVIFLIIGISLSYSTVTETTITIKDKERISDGTSSYYLIFTNNEVFKNDDSIIQLKFDSSDIYNQLNVGGTYKVKVNWFRFPLTSSYRNILEIKK